MDLSLYQSRVFIRLLVVSRQLRFLQGPLLILRASILQHVHSRVILINLNAQIIPSIQNEERSRRRLVKYPKGEVRPVRYLEVNPSVNRFDPPPPAVAAADRFDSKFLGFLVGA